MSHLHPLTSLRCGFCRSIIRWPRFESAIAEGPITNCCFGAADLMELAKSVGDGTKKQEKLIHSFLNERKTPPGLSRHEPLLLTLST